MSLFETGLKSWGIGSSCYQTTSHGDSALCSSW